MPPWSPQGPSRSRSVALVALGWLAGRSLALAEAAHDRCVVLVSIDGCAQFALEDAKSDLPTLHRMAREGAVAVGGMTCSFPTVPWPNHPTRVTGVAPGR